MLARAAGHVGSGGQYLYHALVALAAHGILDRTLWQLRHLVAGKIADLTLGAPDQISPS